MTSSVRNERHLCWTGPEDSSVNSVLFLTGGADATLTDPRPLALLRQGRASGIGKGVKIYKIKNSEMELKRLYIAYDHARRVARGKSRPSRIARMEEAKKELENFGTREEILAESLATYFESIFIDLILNLSSNPNKDEQHYE